MNAPTVGCQVRPYLDNVGFRTGIQIGVLGLGHCLPQRQPPASQVETLLLNEDYVEADFAPDSLSESES